MAYDNYPDERGLRYPLALIYSFVIAVLWIPAFALRRIVCFIREIGVDSWPSANGSVTAGNVKVIHGWVVDYALGQLDYCYRVAGEYYAGRITRQYPDEQSAWEFVDAHRGQPVVVRYKDDKAQSSALRDADQQRLWTSVATPSFFAMVWQHWRDGLRDVEAEDAGQLDPDSEEESEELGPGTTDSAGKL